MRDSEFREVLGEVVVVEGELDITTVVVVVSRFAVVAVEAAC